VQTKTKGRFERALNSIDANFTVALGGMPVSAAEQRTAIEHRQIEPGSGREFAHIDVSPEGAWRTGSKSTVIGARYSHHSQEWAHRYNCRGE
jgi:hypothetical protein